LKVKHPHENAFWKLSVDNSNDVISIKTTLGIQGKLLCYRLSDLDKFNPELGFIPIDKICNLNLGHCDWLTKEREELINKYGHEYWLGHIPYKIFKQLIEWHFWLFGEEYFTEGLVIDKILEYEQQN
jgi:hypothetical protein